MAIAASKFVIRDASRADIVQVKALLRDVGLPTEDLDPDLPGFSLAFAGFGLENSTLVGVAGLERHGVVGLLRSVAVDPAHQGTGLGRRLCERLLDGAARGGVQEIYLLTTTVPAFFARLGFEEGPRSTAPPAIRETEEFGHLCPESAVLMRRTLSP